MPGYLGYPFLWHMCDAATYLLSTLFKANPFCMLHVVSEYGPTQLIHRPCGGHEAEATRTLYICRKSQIAFILA